MSGVYWRGRCWRFAGGSEDGGDPAAELETARGRIVELEAVATSSAEALAAAGARVAELEASGAMLATELQEARQRADEAGRRTLEAHRRVLLAEHRGEVVEELVQGTTVEELERSVEVAKAAYGRVADSVRRGIAEQVVPNGAGPRAADGGEGLSALQKIAQGLRK